MHVFVTGGAGYIGSVCTACLLDAGHAVTVFDNLSEGHAAAVDPRARLVVGDLRDAEAVRSALLASRPDAVAHLAARALVGESMANPTLYFRNNVTGGLNLLGAMVEADVKRLVFSSSCATYGVPQSTPIPEHASQRPVNPYGESKLLFERMLPWYGSAHGLIYVGLRFFNVAGATDHLGEAHRVETHLIPNVIRVALNLKPQLEIQGTDYPTSDGTCVRDFIHVEDVARAHVAALEAKRSDFYNLGLGRGYSVAEVVTAVRTVSGQPVPTVAAQRRPGDPAELVADAAKVTRELGWRPLHTDLISIVRSAWAWHRAHPTGYAAAR